MDMAQNHINASTVLEANMHTVICEQVCGL